MCLVIHERLRICCGTNCRSAVVRVLPTDAHELILRTQCRSLRGCTNHRLRLPDSLRASASQSLKLGLYLCLVV